MNNEQLNNNNEFKIKQNFSFRQTQPISLLFPILHFIHPSHLVRSPILIPFILFISKYAQFVMPGLSLNILHMCYFENPYKKTFPLFLLSKSNASQID